MNKSKQLLLTGISCLSILSLTTSVFANEIKSNQFEEMSQIIESGDYQSWHDLMTEKNPDAPILEKITSNNFSRFQEMHNHMKAAKEIADELDLKPRKDRGQKGQNNNPEMQAAIESGDYQTWKNLVEQKNPDAPILETITEDNFHTLQELHEAREAEDLETVKELAEELGIEKPMKKAFRNR